MLSHEQDHSRDAVVAHEKTCRELLHISATKIVVDLDDDLREILAAFEAAGSTPCAPCSPELPRRTLQDEAAAIAARRLAEPPVAPKIVKTPVRRLRRSRFRDGESASILWTSERRREAPGERDGSWEYVRGATPSPSPLPATSPPASHPPKPDLEDILEGAAPFQPIPSWSETSDLGKLHAFNNVSDLFGEMRAFSLNLSPEKIASFNANHGKATGDGFAAKALKEITRHLRADLDRDVSLWIAVDVAASGRLHLHGAIFLGKNDLPAAEEALKRAGGRWDRRGRERQLDTRPQWHPAGWVGYALKLNPTLKPRFKGRPIAVTRQLAAAGRDLYEARRAAIRHSKSRTGTKPSPALT